MDLERAAFSSLINSKGKSFCFWRAENLWRQCENILTLSGTPHPPSDLSSKMPTVMRRGANYHSIQPLLSIRQNKNAWYSLSTSPSNFRGQKLFQGKETILLWINNWHLSGHVTMQILREWTILQEKTKIYIKKNNILTTTYEWSKCETWLKNI